MITDNARERGVRWKRGAAAAKVRVSGVAREPVIQRLVEMANGRVALEMRLVAVVKSGKQR